MTTLPDIPHALALQRICDLRTTSGPHSVPRRPVVGPAIRTGLRWLWEGQLALVPPTVDPAPPCAS